METNEIVDPSVDLLHPTINNKNLRLRRLSQSRGKGIKSRDSASVTRSRQSSKRRKSPKQNTTDWESWRWKIPLALVVLVLILYASNPTESNIVHPLIFLSYKFGGAPEYDKGLRDVVFVAFYTIVLFFAREFIMHEILRPLAIYLGITSRSKQARFNEQVYVTIYTGVVGPLGLYVMYHSPTWYFSTAGMYAEYPHKTHSAVTKFYYLVQAAFWAQQALVMILGLEKRRRDFKELVMHHVVTVSLIALSYRFHFTMMGVLVYVTHDISDFFLAVSFGPHAFRCFHSYPSPKFHEIALANLISRGPDLQIPQLHRQPATRPVLHSLHRPLGLPAPLHQPEDFVLDPDRVPHHRPIYLRLGS